MRLSLLTARLLSLPLRWVIPGALLLFALLLVAYTALTDLSAAGARVEARELSAARQQLFWLQGSLEYLVRAGNIERARHDIAALGSDPALRRLLLIDDRDQVLASLRVADQGRSAHELLGASCCPGDLNGLTERLDGVRASLAGDVRLSDRRDTVIGLYPVSMGAAPGQLRPSRVGFLYLERDIAAAKAQTRRAVLNQMLHFVVFLAALAAVLAALFHFVLARRIVRLADAAARFGAGDVTARARIGGRDELGALGEALDTMLAQTAHSRGEIEEREQRIRLLLDSTGEGIYGIDLAGQCSFINASAVRLLAYERDSELLGRNMHAVLHYRDVDGRPHPEEECRIYRATRAGTPVVVDDEVFWRADGSSIPVEYRAWPILRDGKPVGGVVSFVDISERRRGERALRESEERYRQLYETMAQGVVYQRTDGTVESANPAAQEMLGLTLDQLQGRSSLDPGWRAIRDDGTDFPGDSRPAMVALREGQPVRGVVMGVFHPSEQRYRWLLINAMPEFRPGDSRPYRVFTTFSDITDRKLAEQGLAESELRFRSIIEASPVPYALNDDDQNIVYLNPAFIRTFGYTHQDMPTLADWWPRAYPDEGYRQWVATEWAARLERARQQGSAFEPMELDVRAKNGTLVSVLASAARLAGTVAGTHLVILYDITDRKLAEQGLAESEARYRVLTDLSPVGVFHTDADGACIYVNRRWSDMAGLDLERARSDGWAQAVHPDDRAAVVDAWQAAADNQPFALEYRFLRPDGSITWVYGQARADHDAGGRVAGYVGTVTDITERKQDEAWRDGQRRTLELLAAGAPLPEVFDTLVLALEQQAEGMRGSVLLLDAGQRVRFLAGPHLPDAYNRALDGLPIGPRAGSCGTAAYEKRQIIVTDIETDPLWADYRQLAAPHGLRACWSQPILDSTGSVLGTFALYYHAVRAPTERELHLITSAAQLAAVVIESRRTRTALAQTEQRFQAIFDQTFQFISLIKPDGAVIEVNQSLLKFAGRPRSEIVGRKIWDSPWWLRSPGAQQQLKDAVARAATGEFVRYEIELTGADDMPLAVDFSLKPVRDDSGRVTLIIPEGRDITELKRARDELAGTSEQLHALLTNMADGFVRLDRDWRYTFVNNSAGRMFGRRPEELIGRNIWEEFPEAVGQPFYTAYHKAMADQKPTQIQSYYPPWDRWFENRIYPGPGGLSIFFDDITDRQKADIEREHMLTELTARNAEMESFVYTISHDLKSPLITIGGFASLLQKDLAAGDLAQCRDSVVEIRDAVAQLQKLIEDLLNLSRSGRIIGARKHVDLSALLERVTGQFVERLLKLGGELSVTAELPTVNVDPDRMTQVFQNLVDNAIKYRSDARPLRIEIGAESADDELRLYVRDNGRGIKPAYHDKVFGLFQRLDTSTEGTGVGLAIARRIIEVHGGRMWVESEPGVGSTFWISLPASAIVKTSGPERVSDDPPAGRDSHKQN